MITATARHNNSYPIARAIFGYTLGPVLSTRDIGIGKRTLQNVTAGVHMTLVHSVR